MRPIIKIITKDYTEREVKTMQEVLKLLHGARLANGRKVNGANLREALNNGGVVNGIVTVGGGIVTISKVQKDDNTRQPGSDYKTNAITSKSTSFPVDDIIKTQKSTNTVVGKLTNEMSGINSMIGEISSSLKMLVDGISGLSNITPECIIVPNGKISDASENLEKDLIKEALNKFTSKTDAAKSLGISVSTLDRKIKGFKITT